MNDGIELKLIIAVQDGLPLVEEPYRAVAEAIGAKEQDVIALLQRMMDEGKIRRIGAVPNHWALGITANGLAVWDVPDERVVEVGKRLGQQPEVSHCYCRERQLPAWRYNIFAMTHGRSREEVLAAIARIGQDLGIADCPHQVLFSTRMRKKTGVRLSAGRS